MAHMQRSLEKIAEACTDIDNTQQWAERGSVFLLVSISRLTNFESMVNIIDAIKRVHALKLLDLGVIDELHM